MLIIFSILLVGIMALGAISVVLIRQSHAPRAHGPSGSHAPATYEAIPELLSPAERSFYGVLQQAAAKEFQIFAKVRLADIVRPVPGPSRSGWQSAFNRITGKHVDFVLCDPLTLGVVLAVELDDKSHRRFERGFRDSLVDGALCDAKIPVLRVAARQSYSPAQIREQILAMASSGTTKAFSGDGTA